MKLLFADGVARLMTDEISICGLRFGAVYSKGDEQLLHASFVVPPALEDTIECTADNGDLSVMLTAARRSMDTLELSAEVCNLSGVEMRLWTINLLECETDQEGYGIALSGDEKDYRFFTYNDEFVSRVDRLDGDKSPFNRQFTQLWASMGVFWPRPADPVYDSEGWCISRDFGGLFRVSTQCGLFAGFTGPGNAFGDVCVKRQQGRAGFYVRSRMDGVWLEPGESRQSETALLLADGPIAAAQRWAATAVVAMGGARVSRPLSGWCSWYQFWGGVTEADVNRAIEEYTHLACKADVLQIDDGYQKMWGQWEPNDRFPSGMRALSDRMRHAGFLPGIYLAPTAVHVDSPVCVQHPDWLQRLPNGDPAITFNGGNHVYLDPTHPQVQAYILQTARMQVEEWGFDYVKYDFTYPLAFGASLYDRKRTTFQIHRDIYRLLRQAIGEDKYLMACVGEPARYAIGYADAARIGPDSSPHWTGMKDALQCVALRMNVNRRWFVSDPDVFFLRAERCELTQEERLFTATVIAMCGGLVMTSDLPSQWDEEAAGIFAKIADKVWGEATALCLGAEGLPEALAAPQGGVLVVALLNWQDEERDITVEPAALGLDPLAQYELWDFWTDTPRGTHFGPLRSDAQPPHSARLFRIKAMEP